MISILLTTAQRSALECAGLDRDDEEERPLLDAWKGARLQFDAKDRDAVWTAVTLCANAEDGAAETLDAPDMVRSARGAALALCNLARKVAKS
jgi:hypothetical protein